jgi:glycosyltransferase involved in cell wall biosynthesis
MIFKRVTLGSGMIKVAHVSIRHTPFDTRIFHKECKTLSNNGYNVSFIVPHGKDEKVDKINIVSLKKADSKFYKVFKNVPAALSKCFKINSEVYHFHDPELIPIGLILKIKGKKVIYDAHEDHPRDVFEKLWPMPLKIMAFIYFSILEKLASTFYDRIVAATPHIALKYPNKKKILLRNFPILELIDRSNKIEIKSDNLILIYQGGITKLRGVKQVIDSLGIIDEKIELLLFGKWESRFEEECRKLEGWKKTKHLGVIRQEELYGYGKSANIGIINYLSSPNNDDSLPNKPFEYMACSLPIIMSDFSHWKEMFKGCALFCNPENPKEIAENIRILAKDPSLREKMGKNGRALVEKEYNWEKESEKLVDMYQGMFN